MVSHFLRNMILDLSLFWAGLQYVIKIHEIKLKYATFESSFFNVFIDQNNRSLGKNIQAAAYNGARTVCKLSICVKFTRKRCKKLKITLLILFDLIYFINTQYIFQIHFFHHSQRICIQVNNG